jgi:hypothetical protein
LKDVAVGDFDLTVHVQETNFVHLLGLSGSFALLLRAPGREG